MPKQELLGEVKKLINLGKEKGFLTYDEVNDALPSDIASDQHVAGRCRVIGPVQHDHDDVRGNGH